MGRPSAVMPSCSRSAYCWGCGLVGGVGMMVLRSGGSGPGRPLRRLRRPGSWSGAAAVEGGAELVLVGGAVGGGGGDDVDGLGVAVLGHGEVLPGGVSGDGGQRLLRAW